MHLYYIYDAMEFEGIFEKIIDIAIIITNFISALFIALLLHTDFHTTEINIKY